MSDNETKSRIITKDSEPDNAPENKPRIVTADSLKKERANGGRHLFCTKKEAADIAASMGQMVYDQLREQHAASLNALQEDLRGKFREIMSVTAINILDIQRRSFSYRIRRDLAVDVAIARVWVRSRLELLRCYAAVFLPWLEKDVPTVLLPEVSELSAFPTCDCDWQAGEVCDSCVDAVAVPQHVSIDEDVPVVARALTLSTNPTE